MTEITRLRAALEPFAEMFIALEHLREKDRDMRLAPWVCVDGPGADGGIAIKEEWLRAAAEALAAPALPAPHDSEEQDGK